jgi:hypothetical protein
MARLPVPGSDNDVWGGVLNDFLSQAHDTDGTLKANAVGDTQVSSISQSKVTGLTSALSGKATDSAVVHKGELFFNVADYGAVMDGTTDDLAAINAAVTAATSTGGIVLISGSCYITGTINLPAGVTLQGRDGNSKILIQGHTLGSDFPAIKIDGVVAYVRNLRIERTGATARSLDGNAIAIFGASDGIVIENVTGVQMYDTFHIAGGRGTVPGTVQRIVLNGCISKNSAQYGFRIDDVDGIELNSCQSITSQLDGVKLRKLTKNVLINGGYFTGGILGDGLDAYVGGDSFVITNGVFSYNLVNGITVKNDDLNLSDPANFGLVRNISISNVRCIGNNGYGLTLHRSSGPDVADEDTSVAEPLVTNATVSGGLYNENGASGILIQSRCISLMGVQCVKNGRHGIYVAKASRDISVIGAHLCGNSYKSDGSNDGLYDGIRINGPAARVQIIGGSSIGSAPDGVASDTDLSGATPTQRYGVRIENTASAILVSGMSLMWNATAPFSDPGGGAMLMPLYSSDTTNFPSIWMPNDKRIYTRRSDGNVSSALYMTTGNSLNIGDSTNAGGMNFLASGDVNCFPKLNAQGEVEINGALNHDGTTVGFYNTTPVVKPTVTGSRGGNAALASLLTALASQGLITDSSSA